MNDDPHHNSLKQYIKDMISVEYDIFKAFSLQLDSDIVKSHSILADLLARAAHESEERIEHLKALSDQEGASFSVAVKSGITAVTGTFAGLYGKIHEHSLSRLVRDDIVALNFASVGYGMMLTLGLSTSHNVCTMLASRAVEEMPPMIVHLTDLLPVLVGEELAKDAPLANPAAVQIAGGLIRDAWRNT